MKKITHVKDFVEQVARLVRERMSAHSVVSLQEYKKISQTKEPTTILVIEDDESMRKALVRLLEGKKHRVLAAGSAIELQNVLYDTTIDLIILDIGLPWIDGYEIARMMKSHSDLKHIPIVFISGQNDMEAMKRGFQVGAHDYISKPFDIEKVSQTIDVILELNDVGH